MALHRAAAVVGVALSVELEVMVVDGVPLTVPLRDGVPVVVAVAVGVDGADFVLLPVTVVVAV